MIVQEAADWDHNFVLLISNILARRHYVLENISGIVCVNCLQRYCWTAEPKNLMNWSSIWRTDQRSNKQLLTTILPQPELISHGYFLVFCVFESWALHQDGLYLGASLLVIVVHPHSVAHCPAVVAARWGWGAPALVWTRGVLWVTCIGRWECVCVCVMWVWFMYVVCVGVVCVYMYVWYVYALCIYCAYAYIEDWIEMSSV